MFDHLHRPRLLPAWNPQALLGALGLAALLLGGLLVAIAWVAARLGLTTPAEPVQVWYEPFDDGRRLEDLEPALPQDRAPEAQDPSPQDPSPQDPSPQDPSP